MSLPFELEVALGAFETAYALDITLIADSDAEVDANSLAASAEVVALFLPATNLQLLGHAGKPASAQLVDRRLSPDGRRWSMRLLVANLPSNALALLVALLAQTTHAGDPLARVLLRAPAAEQPRNADWLLATAQARATLLPRKSPPPFQLVFDQAQRKQRLVSLEFASELDPDTVELYEQAMAVWDELVIHGAFQLSFDAQDGFDPSMGRFNLPERHVLEHRLFCCGDDVVAFRSMLGLLEFLHPQAQPLVRVRIA